MLYVPVSGAYALRPSCSIELICGRETRIGSIWNVHQAKSVVNQLGGLHSKHTLFSRDYGRQVTELYLAFLRPKIL